MTQTAIREQIAQELKQTSPDSPRHKEIRISGDRAGFDGRFFRITEREVQRQLRRRPVEVNYSELVLKEYQKLQDLHKHESRNEEAIGRCKAQIEELQFREAEQIEGLLHSRLALPLGEEGRLKQATEALLNKYGHLTADD